MWHLIVTENKRYVYVEGDEQAAKERALNHGKLKAYWGPFPTLVEASAKERFCDFGNGIWVDSPIKDKKYRKLYVPLDEYIKRADVIILRSQDEPMEVSVLAAV
jgi:hypothetical protein